MARCGSVGVRCWFQLMAAAFVMCIPVVIVGLPQRPVDYVDTRIGTGAAGYGIGQVNPGPQVPFGAMRLGPDTSSGQEPFRISFEAFGGYWYEHAFIEAMSLTHMVGSGVNGFQNIGFMVARRWDNTVINNANYRSRFTHEQEVAVPGYYGVELLSSQTYAELTASGTHTAMQRFTCRFDAANPTSPAVLFIDVCHSALSTNQTNMGGGCGPANVSAVEAVGPASSPNSTFKISGAVRNIGDFSLGSHNGFMIYFHAIVEATYASNGTVAQMQPGMWMDNHLLDGISHNTTTSGSLGVGLLSTVDANGEAVVFSVRVGISFVSQALAAANLNAQQTDPDSGMWLTFEEARNRTHEQWNSLLSRVTIHDATITASAPRLGNLTTFFSALYKAHMAPTVYTESDGSFLGLDFNVYTSENGTRRISDLSLWDIYRTQAPLMLFTDPRLSRDLVHSMLQMTVEAGGALPKWILANVDTQCMVGTHSAIIMCDAATKGLGGIDPEVVFAAVSAGLASRNQELEEYGYITSEMNSQGASVTLDYALDAGAAQGLALMLGKTAEATALTKYAQAYRNVFDNASLLMCPRSETGNFSCPNPLVPYPLSTSYTEGSGAMYRWYVPHDIPGLVGLMRGGATFARKLHRYFELSLMWPYNTTVPNWTFWAGNEPDLLTPVLFAFAGNTYAYLTSFWFPQLLAQYYFPDPAGLPGNDDYGTMSSWCTFGYLGIYPVASTTQYVLFTPQFDNVTISIPVKDASFSIFTAPGDDGRQRRRDEQASEESTALAVLRLVAYNRPPTPQLAYLVNATVNGVPLGSPIVTQAQLLRFNASRVSTIEFFLSDHPTVFGAPSPSQGGPRPWLPPNFPALPGIARPHQRTLETASHDDDEHDDDGVTPEIRQSIIADVAASISQIIRGGVKSSLMRSKKAKGKYGGKFERH